MMDLIEAGEKTQDDLDTLPLPKIPYVRTTHIFPHVEIFLAVYACALLLSIFIFIFIFIFISVFAAVTITVTSDMSSVWPYPKPFALLMAMGR